MASYNHCTLMGNVTRDIELRHTPNGTAVAEIGLAVNRTWFDKQANEKKEEVSFIDCVAFGRTAEIAAEYLAKGRPVHIDGRLTQDRWTDKESGQQRSKLKITIQNLQLLGSRGDSGSQQQSAPAQSSGGEDYADVASSMPADDDVPF